MKKIVCRFAIAFAMLSLLLSSCAEKERTYTYVCQYYGYIEEKEAADQLLEYLDNVFDGYFSKPHAYTGLAAETIQKAAAEFELYCGLLDEDTITHHYLSPGEQLIISLVEQSSGATISYAVWTNSDEVDPDDDLL